MFWSFWIDSSDSSEILDYHLSRNYTLTRDVAVLRGHENISFVSILLKKQVILSHWNNLQWKRTHLAVCADCLRDSGSIFTNL